MNTDFEIIPQGLPERADEIIAVYEYLKRETEKIGLGTTDLSKIPLESLKGQFLLLLYNYIEGWSNFQVKNTLIRLSNMKLPVSELNYALEIFWIENYIIKYKLNIEYSKGNFNTFNLDNFRRKDEKGNESKEYTPIDEFMLKLFSGNVDVRAIRNLFQKFGLDIDFNIGKNKGLLNGDMSKRIEQLKNKRNQLAHGVKSFMEIGGEYNMEELKDITNSVFRICYRIEENIEDYFNNKKYLR